MCWWLWLTRTSWVTCSPLGKVLLFLHGSLGNLCWFYPWKGLVCSIGKFLCNSRRGCLRVSNSQGSPSMILYFTGDLVDDLNSRGSFFGNFWSIEGCFWCFPFIGNALRVFMSFTQLRVFSSFWSILEFLINFLPFGNPLGIFEIFFFTKLCVV